MLSECPRATFGGSESRTMMPVIVGTPRKRCGASSESTGGIQNLIPSFHHLLMLSRTLSRCSMGMAPE